MFSEAKINEMMVDADRDNHMFKICIYVIVPTQDICF
jgi:hypothetical protein